MTIGSRWLGAFNLPLSSHSVVTIDKVNYTIAGSNIVTRKTDEPMAAHILLIRHYWPIWVWLFLASMHFLRSKDSLKVTNVCKYLLPVLTEWLKDVSHYVQCEKKVCPNISTCSQCAVRLKKLIKFDSV